jgi:predicted  nucleic acid-binding Zn-ribbon protein
MSDITVKRSYRIEGDDYIAVKESFWQNGLGKDMHRMDEEHGLTLVEIEKAIDEEIPEEMTKGNADIAAAREKIEAVRAEVQATFDDPEYQMFKEMLKEEKYRGFFKALNAEREIRNFEGQIVESEKVHADIQDWGQQMTGLRDLIKGKLS